MKKEFTAERKYAEKMKEKGFVKTCLWVPKGEVKRVQVFADGLRKTHHIAGNYHE